jgi:ribosomal protein L5
MKATIEVQNDVIFRRFHGEVRIDDMIDSWKEILTLYDDLSCYKGIVTSFMDAEIQSGVNSLNIMVEFFKDQVDRISGMKVAIVMDTPKVTSTIIMNQKMKHLHIRPFSSETAALEWIDS